MALQYLDAESIPYFVVLRSSGGTYQGSWSSAYSMKFQGDYAVLIGHNNAEMGLKIKFNEIDWGACLPIPDPIPTDTEGYMAYLSILFTGQQGTLVPPRPEPQAQYFYTTPIINIQPQSSVSLYIPFAAGRGATELTEVSVIALIIGGTLDEIKLLITSNTLDGDIIIDFFVDKSLFVSTTILAGAIGVIDFDVTALPLIAANTEAYFRIGGDCTTGGVTISSIRTKITPTV